VEDEEPAEVADAVAASSRSLSDDAMELAPAVRDDATEDKGRLLEAAPPALFT
jgi:hypothetical protein